jgi:hypothetical protein
MSPGPELQRLFQMRSCRAVGPLAWALEIGSIETARKLAAWAAAQNYLCSLDYYRAPFPRLGLTGTYY